MATPVPWQGVNYLTTGNMERLRSFSCEVTEVINRLVVVHSIHFGDPNGIVLEAAEVDA